MLHQKRRKSMFTIRALSIGILAFGTWFHQTDAYAMGAGILVEGDLATWVPGSDDGIFWELPIGQCVLKGIASTGHGVEAISYKGQLFECRLWNQVDNLINEQTWCSQWVFPGSPDECLELAKPKKPDAVEVRFNDCMWGDIYSYTGTWDSTTLNPGEYFEVDYSSGTGWIPWFEGAASCHAIHTTFPEINVRVRVVDIWGQVSDWIVVFADGNCGHDPF